ncbi:MAG: DNA helicase II, partial [Alphaproteobacteria bacterium]
MSGESGGGLAARAMAGLAAGQMPWLEGLNPEQRAAVETLDGPLLMLAGAGTGKTRALTARIAHLIGTGRARPGAILAVTFTNKAAREMRERLAALLGPVGAAMGWVGTFHALSVRMLRRHAELVGLKANFTILDTDDQLRLLRQIIRAENMDERRWPARALAHLIDQWKNRALTPADLGTGEASAFNGRGPALYALYQERLKVLNAADFGDLLLHMITIFRGHPDVLAEWQRRFSHILVDEYQDTNTAQYLWLRMLAEGHGNLCVVGDDDQSIYGWRGADVGNILRFERDWPGAKVIRLERNYRSGAHILGAASGLIAANEGRLGKTLRPVREGGEKLRLIGHWDGEDEARWVGEEVERLVREGLADGPVAASSIAILVRATHQMRPFEDRFLQIGLPYRVVGGPRFYERQEIRDALAYLRLAVSPADDLAFERIVNTPRRGLGEKARALIAARARARGIAQTEAAAELVAEGALTA